MINSWTQNGRIKASYRDKDGVLEIRDLGPAEYAAFVRDPQPFATDLRVSEIRDDFPGWHKLLFHDYDSRKECLEQHRDLLFEGDVSPVRRFISDHHCKIDPPRRSYLDIETDSRVPFSKAVWGEARLLSWALVDADGNKFSAALADDSDQAEAELWACLWSAMGAHYDQVAAWNGDKFDFEVMKYRCEALAKRYTKTMEPYWEHRRRILLVDHLACFRRHHMAAESGDDKTSFALGAVCEALIGEGKNDFDSSKTWEAWEAGGAARQELVAYNVQDTALLPKLEAATGYLALQQTLNELTYTFCNSHGLKPSPQVDGYMLRMAHKRKTHLRSKPPGGGAEGEQYEGAFVQKPTNLGIHRTVHVCDFKSLYPTVMRTFNISPETKATGTQRCKAFRTDVEFDVSTEGMLCIAMREGMDLREHYKQEYKKDPNNKGAEQKSKACKIFCNSFYGVMGNSYSRFYDVQIAESITLSARHLNDATADAARERGWEPLYMDTDSLFVKGCTVDEFKAFVTWCNAELYPRILAERGVPKGQNVIALDYEKAFDRLVFPLGNDGTPAAKRYVGSYLHYAFRPKAKPEIRGLEYMRSDSVRLARKMQKEVTDLILSGKDDPQFFHDWVKRKRELFFDSTVEVDDIAKSAGISMALSAYKSKGPHVRLAEALEAEGEDVSEGTRISYVVKDSTVSPMEVILASDFDGITFDRFYYWNKAIYPCVMRVLAGAFPGSNWARWVAKRPKPVLPGQLTLLG